MVVIRPAPSTAGPRQGCRRPISSSRRPKDGRVHARDVAVQVFAVSNYTWSGSSCLQGIDGS